MTFTTPPIAPRTPPPRHSSSLCTSWTKSKITFCLTPPPLNVRGNRDLPPSRYFRSHSPHQPGIHLHGICPRGNSAAAPAERRERKESAMVRPPLRDVIDDILGDSRRYVARSTSMRTAVETTSIVCVTSPISSAKSKDGVFPTSRWIRLP